MDDVTFQSLRQALAASPDNVALLGVLLEACATRDDPDTATALLDGWDPDALPDDAARRASTLLLQAHRPERALDFAAGDDPATLVQRARCLEALGRQAEAREAYATAVAARPDLEDTELRARLASEVRAASTKEGSPTLRLLSGGDTADRIDESTVSTRPTITFDEVGGLDDVKKRIRRKIILPMQKPSLFQRFRRRAGGGVLLYGPPGCGKTLLARATAGETNARFFDVKISDVLDMWIGESEQKLHQLFEKARADRPSVLFFDEVEALGGKRQNTRNDASMRLVSQFLAELDGFDTDNDGVLVLAATNVPWSVDPAFRRPGRFERVLFVPPPDRTAREAILGIHLADRPVADDVDVAKLARRTSGYSGADLEHVVETAADLAIEHTLDTGEETPITAALLDEALDDVKPTTAEWLTTARNFARYANESGQYDEVLDFLRQHGAKR